MTDPLLDKLDELRAKAQETNDPYDWWGFREELGASYDTLARRLRAAEKQADLANLAKDYMSHSVHCRSVMDYQSRRDAIRECTCGLGDWFKAYRKTLNPDDSSKETLECE